MQKLNESTKYRKGFTDDWLWPKCPVCGATLTMDGRGLIRHLDLTQAPHGAGAGSSDHQGITSPSLDSEDEV